MTKLSEAQLSALRALRDGPIDDAAALVRLGPSRNRTLSSLAEIGLARYFPTARHWRITPDGRDYLARLDRLLAAGGQP